MPISWSAFTAAEWSSLSADQWSAMTVDASLPFPGAFYSIVSTAYQAGGVCATYQAGPIATVVFVE